VRFELKPYPNLQDSSVRWLEEIPELWGVQRLRNAVSMRVSNVDKHVREGEVPVRLCNYVDVYMNDYIDEQIKFMQATATSEEVKRFRLDEGDVLITKDSETWDDIGVPALVTNQAPDLISGYHLALLRPNTDVVDGAFLLRALQSTGLAYQLLPIPSLPEQAVIAHYLDYIDRRIHRYIRAKKKLIALIEEYKQAIINQAVTRGLNPDVKMKSTGYRWFSRVPEHWTLGKLKFACSHIVDCLHATPSYTSEGAFPAIRTADISPGITRIGSAKRVDKTTYEQWTQRLKPREGDILYSREGERYGIGACVPSKTKLCISQRMMVFRVKDEHNSRFLMWLLNSPQVHAQATQDVMGATAPHVNISTICNFALALPSRAEQDDVIDYVESATGGFENAVSVLHQDIEFLCEYRTRLISDVVTGKVDVRETAAQLPNKEDEEKLQEEYDGHEGDRDEDQAEYEDAEK